MLLAKSAASASRRSCMARASPDRVRFTCNQSCPQKRRWKEECKYSRPAPKSGRERIRSFRKSRPKRSASTSTRSEEHTSELQSRLHLVCRLLLEKKKKKKKYRNYRQQTNNTDS